MAAIGGSLESVTFNGRLFPVAADVEVQVKLGGFENEVQANGDGSSRMIKTRVPSSADGLSISIDADRGDHEFLQDLADGNAFFATGFNYASGDTYSGTMQIVGEMQASTQSATAAVSVMGPGKLTKQ